MSYDLLAGTTNHSVTIRIIDATDGTPELGVVFDTSGLALSYRREGALVVEITEIDLTSPALTDAHEDGGFLAIGDGYYRLDLPDAATASGVTGVLVGGSVTGMVVIGEYIHLVAVNSQDATRMGITALPNANAEAAGGLYTRGTGAGQLNQTANGRSDANVVALATSVITNQACAANFITESKLAANMLTNSQFANDALSELNFDAFYWLRVATEIAADAVVSLINDGAPAVGDFDGASALTATDDFYNGSVLVFTGGALKGIARRITNYVGSSRNIQFSGTGDDADAPFPTAPSDTDTFLIVGRIGA